MSIPIVDLVFDNSEVVALFCPACGELTIAPGGNPDPCAHVEFVSFPAGDMEYIREDLDAAVSEWREKAEEKEEEFDLVEALCERDDPTSFVFRISWSGMPDTLSVGFHVDAVEEDDI